MTGLDTNILVRHLTQDDPIYSPLATDLIERSMTEDDPGFVSLVTIVELAWVLRSTYGWEEKRIAETFRVLLQAENLILQNQEEVFVAVSTVALGRGKFADALVGSLGRWAGCDTTLTFDAKASQLGNFTRV